MRPLRTLAPAVALGLATLPAWAATTTWNPSDKGSSIVLSNGNLTAAANGTWYTVRATTSKACCSSTDGKWIWKVTANANDGFWIGGMADGTMVLNGFFVGNGAGNDVGWHEDGVHCYAEGTGISCAAAPAIGTGSWFVAFDATTGKVFISTDCATWGGGGTPDAGTATVRTTLNGGDAYYPAWSGGDGTSADQATINTNPSLAGCTGVSTYAVWDSSGAGGGAGSLPLLGVGH